MRLLGNCKTEGVAGERRSDMKPGVDHWLSSFHHPSQTDLAQSVLTAKFHLGFTFVFNKHNTMDLSMTDPQVSVIVLGFSPRSLSVPV